MDPQSFQIANSVDAWDEARCVGAIGFEFAAELGGQHLFFRPNAGNQRRDVQQGQQDPNRRAKHESPAEQFTTIPR